jgi:hypothetical protein
VVSPKGKALENKEGLRVLPFSSAKTCFIFRGFALPSEKSS